MFAIKVLISIHAGGTVASQLVHSTPERAVQVRAQAGGIEL